MKKRLKRRALEERVTVLIVGDVHKATEYHEYWDAYSIRGGYHYPLVTTCKIQMTDISRHTRCTLQRAEQAWKCKPCETCFAGEIEEVEGE